MICNTAVQYCCANNIFSIVYKYCTYCTSCIYWVIVPIQTYIAQFCTQYWNESERLGLQMRQNHKAESKTELSLVCSLRFHSRNIQKLSRNLHLGYLKRHNAIRGAYLNGTSLLLLNCPSGHWLKLLTWLSTNVQSLEHSIEGSTKLGQVKIGQGDYLKSTQSSIPDPRYYLIPIIWLSDLFPMFYRAGIQDHHGQHPTSLLGIVCKLTSRVHETSHSRQKISLKKKFQRFCFYELS